MDANGNQDIHDAAMRIGILSQRTTNLETLVQSINHSIGAMSSKVDERFNALSATMAERNKTQWPVIFLAIGVASSVLGYFVTQALTPIRDANLDMKSSIVALADATKHGFELVDTKYVSHAEIQWRSDRAVEDRGRIEDTLSDMRATTVARSEWMEKNSSRDHDIQNLRESQAASVMAVQRQIDQIRGDLATLSNSLGNGRDTFAEMRAEIRRLAERLDSIPVMRSRM